MKRTVLVDPYLEKQPPLTFADDLKKPLFTVRPDFYGRRERKDGEIDARGIYLAGNFEDDPDNLLQTVYDDFARFTAVYGIGGTTFPVFLERRKTECFEAFSVRTAKNGVTVSAGDTEGIRRGIIWLEDELRRKENAFLSPGTVVRVPQIRSRVSRCFFSPTNRPPRMLDELENETDYYPGEYLNRLMHDGTNGIWIYTRFSDLMPSVFIPEYGEGCEKRIKKLARVVEKCRRYGIGVYLFAIEPNQLSPELAARHPELAGAAVHEPKSATETFIHRFPMLYDKTLPRTAKTLCVNTKAGKEYCREAGRQLAVLVPHLKGMIDITFGERDTSCASVFGGDCPHCAGKKPGVLLAEAVEALRCGMRESNPDFEFISWTYGHRTWETDDILDYVRSAPDDVMLMQNFDDNGYAEQLGKPRLAIDYWLSYAGPSEMFVATANEAKKDGKHLFAKMQVCCSHEIASVPYVPVPGCLIKKYAGAYRYGVTGILQCWYMGNYPCLMSKAAGELSFMTDFSDEDAFLTRLAAITFGESRAAQAVKAWKYFEQGYAAYPVNILFSYYGPAHDSVVWPLWLKPRNFSPARTWSVCDPAGDRIYEALLCGHTLTEAVLLFTSVSENWHKGAELYRTLCRDNPDETEQLSVVTAIDLLFAGAKDVLVFYLLRDKLGRGDGAPTEILHEMRKIILRGITQSEAMIPLCNADNRLGYHSEAEGYKFFQKKLTGRISALKEVLATEFPEVEKRIADGLAPLDYYCGEENYPEVKRYALQNIPVANAAWENIDDGRGSRFRMAYDKEALYLELFSEQSVTFVLSPEYELMRTDADVYIAADGTVEVSRFEEMYFSLFGEKKQAFLKKYENRTVFPGVGTHVLFTLSLKTLGIDRIRPMKMRLEAGGVSWSNPGHFPVHLGKPYTVAAQYGWIIPEKQQ